MFSWSLSGTISDGLASLLSGQNLLGLLLQPWGLLMRNRQAASTAEWGRKGREVGRKNPPDLYPASNFLGTPRLGQSETCAALHHLWPLVALLCCRQHGYNSIRMLLWLLLRLGEKGMERSLEDFQVLRCCCPQSQKDSCLPLCHDFYLKSLRIGKCVRWTEKYAFKYGLFFLLFGVRNSIKITLEGEKSIQILRAGNRPSGWTCRLLKCTLIPTSCFFAICFAVWKVRYKAVPLKEKFHSWSPKKVTPN